MNAGFKIVIFVISVLLLMALIAGAVFFLFPDNWLPWQSSIEVLKDEDKHVATPEFDPEPKSKNDQDYIQTEEVVDWREHIPAQAVDLKQYELDLEGDNEPEIAVFYRNPQVQVKKDDVREIHYLKIFQKTNDQWRIIKQDEVTAKGGVVDKEFCLFKVVNLGQDEKQELFVSKCDVNWSSVKGLTSYYIFGQNHDGALQDLALPKGYLNQDQMNLDPQDDFIMLKNVEVSAGGITERYQVACFARDWYASRFGNHAGGFCRAFDWFIPYDDDVFGPTEIQNSEILIFSSDYQTKYLNDLDISFSLPIWLHASDIYKGTHIQLFSDDNLSKYVMYFGLNLDAIVGYLPGEMDIVSNGENLTEHDIDLLLQTFCDSWLNNENKITGTQCQIDHHVAIVNEGGLQIMLRLFPGSRDSVRISTRLENRDANYFDQAVMRHIIDSFEIVGPRLNEMDLLL